MNTTANDDDLNALQLPRDRQYTEAELAQYVWKPTAVRFLRGEKHEAYNGCENRFQSDSAEFSQHRLTCELFLAAEQLESVETKRVEWWATLAMHERRRDASDIAVFEPTLNCFRAVRVGKAQQTSGFKPAGAKGGVYFSLEEALFLADSGRMMLIHNGEPMLLGSVYALLARTPGGMDQYLVYAYLRRAGHIVRRVGTTPPFKLRAKAADAAANAAEMEMDLRDYEFLRSLDNFAPVDLGIDDNDLIDSEEDEEEDDDDEEEDEDEDDNAAAAAAADDEDDENVAASTTTTTSSKKRSATHDKSAKRNRATVPSEAEEPSVAVAGPTDPCFHLFTTLVKKFKRSAPGAPDFCCFVRNYSEPFPTITESLRMLQRSNGVPLLLCVVQGNSLTFFSMQLPHHRTATMRLQRAASRRHQPAKKR